MTMVNQPIVDACVRDELSVVSSGLSHQSDNRGGNTMDTFNSVNIHIFDHESGRLFLDEGDIIDFGEETFFDPDEAIEEISTWAKRQELIEPEDVVASFL